MPMPMAVLMAVFSFCCGPCPFVGASCSHGSAFAGLSTLHPRLDALSGLLQVPTCKDTTTTQSPALGFSFESDAVVVGPSVAMWTEMGATDAQYSSSSAVSFRVPDSKMALSSCATAVALMVMLSMKATMPVYSMLLVTFLPSMEAVCTHCKDTIPGCTGGTACPLIADASFNAAIFEKSTLGACPKIANLVCPELASFFPRPTCEAIVGLACAPAVGRVIDFSTAAYVKASAVVQAAMYRHCSVAEAASELAKRLEDATTELDSAKISGAMNSLKMIDESIAHTSRGVYTFVWSKVTMAVMKRDDGSVKLVLSGKSTSSDLSATMVRPTNSDEFYEMIHYFQMIVVALGLATEHCSRRFKIH